MTQTQNIKTGVQFQSKFVKQYRTASPKIQSQFNSRLIMFQKNINSPLLNNHALTGKYKGYRSINVTGDWRAIYQPLDSNSVLFVALGTHSQLYK